MPSIPLAPRLESTRGRGTARRQVQLDVADRHRGGDEQRRLRVEPLPEAAGDERLGEAALARRGLSASAAAAASSASRQAASHAGSGAPSSARSSAAGCPAPDPVDDSGRVLPAGAGVDERLLDLGGQRGEPGAQRLGGRQIADADARARGEPGGEGRVAQQQVVGGDRVRSLARARVCGSASTGTPRRSANAAISEATCSSSSVRPATSTVRGGRGTRPASARCPRGARRGRPTVARPRGPRAPAGSCARRLAEDERLAQRHVEMDRTGPALERRPVGAAGELPDPAHRRGVEHRRELELAEPLGVVAVELELIDRLAGADVAQLGRPIGGEHDQRDPAPVRLHDGGHQLRGGRPRRARDRDRAPARPRGADGEEPGAALVDVREAAQPRAPGRATSTIGVLRDPGEVHASRIPQRASSSTSARSIRCWSTEWLGSGTAAMLVTAYRRARHAWATAPIVPGHDRARPAARLHEHRGELGRRHPGAPPQLSRPGPGHPRPRLRLGRAPGDARQRARRGRRARARSLHARRLLPGRADRAARGARHARPGRAPRPDRREPRPRRRRPSARSAAAPTRRSPPGPRR